MNTQPLKELGLSENEIKVYLSGLRTGLATATSYAEKSNLPRTTTYDLLKSLKEKGLASHVIKSGVKYFGVVNPKELIEKLQEKEKNLKEILPELQNLQQATLEQPKVEFYQGVEGFKTVANDIFNEPGLKEFDSFVAEKTLEFLPIFHVQFRRKRREKKIFVRMLAEKTSLMQDMKKKDKEELRETRFLDNVMKGSNTSFFVYSDKVAYILATEKEQIGVIVKNKDIANFQRKLYNELWQSAKP